MVKKLGVLLLLLLRRKNRPPIKKKELMSRVFILFEDCVRVFINCCQCYRNKRL